MEYPIDRASLELLETSLTKRRAKLVETNEALEEEIRTQEYSAELRKFYEIRQENLQHIDEVDQTLEQVRQRLGLYVLWCYCYYIITCYMY